MLLWGMRDPHSSVSVQTKGFSRTEEEWSAWGGGEAGVVA